MSEKKNLELLYKLLAGAAIYRNPAWGVNVVFPVKDPEELGEDFYQAVDDAKGLEFLLRYFQQTEQERETSNSLNTPIKEKKKPSKKK